MFDQATLRALIIIWRDHQHTVGSHSLCVLGVLQRVQGVVAPNADDYLHAAGGVIDRDSDQLVMLVLAQCSVLSCGAADYDCRRTVFVLMIQILLQPFIVNAVFVKGRDERSTGAFE